MNLTESLSTETPFVSYAYSYPHKSAYRSLDPKIPLESLWAHENREALFLYFHLPFCEYRCGFCNLFTLANPEQGLVPTYIAQLRREAERVQSTLSEAKFARIAIGGGTPTFLDDRELGEFLEIATEVLDATPKFVPASCEASPATLNATKAALLREWGVDRLSLGVQSFDRNESRALGRPQDTHDVYRAIDIVRGQGFPTLNLDLIYGIPGQSLDSWMRTVIEALHFQPEEIYLYPLYVRELTGLGRTARTANQERLQAYRIAREKILQAGYLQKSMRMFQRPGEGGEEGPVYCCQSNGMVGLGCGARSYTRSVHYSTEFAVKRTGVRSILSDYLNRPSHEFLTASHGYRLDEEDQRRRYAILSLLQADGMTLSDYHTQFQTEVWEDLPQTQDLLHRGLAEVCDGSLVLTAAGLEMSDAIGPWLYSRRVRELMQEHKCR